MIHDLGGGSGAMGRWLAPRLPGPQHWVVHDRDAGLLELAVAAPPGPAAVTIEARRSDVTGLAPGELAGASLVTASALLDLLTADELARMLGACAGLPMLLALTVVGSRDPDPGGSPRRADRAPRSTPTSAVAACSVRTPSRPPSMRSAGRAPRSSSGRAPGASMRPTPT